MYFDLIIRDFSDINHANVYNFIDFLGVPISAIDTLNLIVKVRCLFFYNVSIHFILVKI